MSKAIGSIVKGVGKVFKSVFKAVKKILPVVLLAAAAVYTGGAALLASGVTALASGFTGAVSTFIGGLGATGTAGTLLTNAITGAGVGALTGGVGALVTGGDVMEGITKGAMYGGVVGGVGGTGVSNLLGGGVKAFSALQEKGADATLPPSTGSPPTPTTVPIAAATSPPSPTASLPSATTLQPPPSDTPPSEGSGISGWLERNPELAKIGGEALVTGGASFLQGKSEQEDRERKERHRQRTSNRFSEFFRNAATGQPYVPGTVSEDILRRRGLLKDGESGVMNRVLEERGLLPVTG